MYIVQTCIPDMSRKMYLRCASTDDLCFDLLFSQILVHCLWVAEIGGSVVGMVAAHCLQDGSIELLRMSVDQRFRCQRVGVALGQQVLKFARLCARSSSSTTTSVVLGTTAYMAAPHRLYLALGFRCVGITEGFSTPGIERSLLERAFYRVRHHHYKVDLK